MNLQQVFLCVVVLMNAACATQQTEPPVAGRAMSEKEFSEVLERMASGAVRPTTVDSNDPDKARKMDEAFKAGRPVLITINPITEIHALGMKAGKMVRKEGDPIMVTIGMSERDQIGLADALFQRVIGILLKEYRWTDLMAPSVLPVSCGIEVSGLGGKEMSAVLVEVRCGLKAAVETGNGVFVGRTIHSMLTLDFDTRVDQIPVMIDEAYREATKLLASK